MDPTNTDGAFLTIRESLKTMRRHEWGRVIADLFHGRIARPARAGGLTLRRNTGMSWADQIPLAADYLGQALYVHAICPWLRGTPQSYPQHAAISATCWYFRRKKHARSLVNSNRITFDRTLSEVTAAAHRANRPRFAKASNGQCIQCQPARHVNCVAGHNLLLGRQGSPMHRSQPPPLLFIRPNAAAFASCRIRRGPASGLKTCRATPAISPGKRFDTLTGRIFSTPVESSRPAHHVVQGIRLDSASAVVCCRPKLALPAPNLSNKGRGHRVISPRPFLGCHCTAERERGRP